MIHTQTIGADLIISAIGVSPNTHWLPPELVRAEDNGLLVDERLCCPTGSDAPAGSSEYWGGDNARQAACAAIPERTVYAGRGLRSSVCIYKQWCCVLQQKCASCYTLTIRNEQIQQHELLYNMVTLAHKHCTQRETAAQSVSAAWVLNFIRCGCGRRCACSLHQCAFWALAFFSQ